MLNVKLNNIEESDIPVDLTLTKLLVAHLGHAVEFYVKHNKLVYEFSLPNDFGNGGFSIIDEKMMK
jgi:hypothetical protein